MLVVVVGVGCRSGCRLSSSLVLIVIVGVGCRCGCWLSLWVLGRRRGCRRGCWLSLWVFVCQSEIAWSVQW